MPPVAGEEQGPLAGQLLAGRYRLDALIAAGGMGEVWSARDEVLGRRVAVKLIKDTHAADEAFLSRFRAEARYAAALSHPGIAQVFDYGERHNNARGRPYLVMELVTGRQLSALIARAGGLPAGVMLDITGQAARALQAAHDIGITHRDIKPGNLLITDDGRVKVTDFGIAGAAPGSQATDASDAGLVLGTAAYMSPEQAEGKPVTPASDVYSLGIVAYQCVAGRLPFTAGTPLALAIAHAEDRPRPLPAGVPGPVRDLVMRMIAKDPRRRPGSAREVAESASLLRDETLLTPGPQLADVAAWVAARADSRPAGADLPSTTVAQLPAGVRPAAARHPRRRAVFVAAVLGTVAVGLSAAIAAAIVTGNPAAVTGHLHSHGPVAQPATHTPRPTHRSTAHPSQAPPARSAATSQTAQPAGPRPAAPPSSTASPPRTPSPVPTPSRNPTPSPSPSPPAPNPGGPGNMAAG
jgi:eukaryotic-like serine/threonine-protein kinase